MKITKFGHCCLLIEEQDARILTDPGSWNDLPEVRDLDAILISHEHADHIHIESVKQLLETNKNAIIYTHPGVKKLLDTDAVPCVLVADGEELVVKGVSVMSSGSEHACIHHEMPLVQNTGFYIAGKFFYPGDSFHNPHKLVEVLSLPVSGPWMKIEEAIEYAKAIKPKVVFPVHDAMLREDRREFTRRLPKMLLDKSGIEFVDMTEGSVVDF